MQEIATESGKLVVVPDDRPISGPMAEYVGRLPANSKDPVRIYASGTWAPRQPCVQQFWICPMGEAPVGTGWTLLGEVSSRPGMLVVADPQILYRKWFGIVWNRTDEKHRAMRAATRRCHGGSSYMTDVGERALSVRVSAATSRYRVEQIGSGFRMIAVAEFSCERDSDGQISGAAREPKIAM